MALSDIRTQWKPVKPWVEPVVAEICRTRRIYFVWGKSSGTSGEHPLGRALDFSILEYGGGVSDPGPARPKLGEEIANYLWAHRKRLNVWYVIWNRRIISITRPEAGWRPYTGSSPHTDHVHVSFKESGIYQPPPEVDDMSWDEKIRPQKWAEQAGYYKGAGDPAKWTAATHQANTNALVRALRLSNMPKLSRGIAANTALLRELVARGSDLSEEQVENAVREGVAGAVDVDALASAVVSALDQDVDIEVVKRALTEALGRDEEEDDSEDDED